MDNSINKAISLAIEKGGYEGFNTWNGNPNYYVVEDAGLIGTRMGGHSDLRTPEQVICDPQFWQALIKATCDMKKTSRTWWKTKALEYFKLVLTGGDTEKFWKELINKP